MNKYLFLDIDGVLNHDEWFESDGYRKNRANWQISMFDPVCVERVNKILDVTGARLVVSSSWRSMTDLEDIFAGVGLPTTFWRTPHADMLNYKDDTDLYSRDYDNPKWWRGSEIDYWLDRYDPGSNYVIIDDDCDMLPHQMEYFIQTCGDRFYTPKLYEKNGGSGLTETVMSKAIDILNRNLNGNTTTTD